MQGHEQAALEMNRLATEMNDYHDAHVDLIARLIGLTEEVSNGPNAETIEHKAALVADFDSEGLHDWAARLKEINW